MTYGQLFMRMNPNVKVVENGTCVWIFFDEVNHDTMRKGWWDKEIPDDANDAGWISVKDRLPDSNRFVLVCNDDGHMMIAQYIEETAQWQYKYINYDVDVWDDEEQGPVCYWAYLPEPPKEGNDNG